MKTINHFVFILLATCSLLAGQQVYPPVGPQAPSPAGSSHPQDISKQDMSQYVLGPDDQIKIWSLGMEEISDKPIRIDPSGNIDLPMVGRVHAAGLTVEQLKTNLVQKFAKQVLKPQVSVEIVDFGSQPVSVMGAVSRPGVFQLRGRKTLSEVLSMADGLKQEAGPHIIISRQIQYGPVPLPGVRSDPTGKFSVAEVGVKELLEAKNPADNILILPHDVITVPAADVVFVIGEVRKPGEVPLKDSENIPVLQALSSAQGSAPGSAPQNAKIIRIVAGTKERKEIPIDLNKVMQGKAEDVAMWPNDILVVPPNAPKRAALRALDAAIQTATGIAIWRGGYNPNPAR
jgi:polysaccharide export outer membrane protein